MLLQLRCTFLLLVCISQHANGEYEKSMNMSDLVDFFLPAVQRELVRGMGLAPIPDLKKTWTKAGITASVDCTGGTFASLGNISRSGSATMKKIEHPSEEGFTFASGFELNDLRLHYENCHAKGAGLHTSTPLLLMFDSISFNLKLSIRRTPDGCTNELETLQIWLLWNLKAETGDGWTNWVKKVFVNCVANLCRPGIMNGINRNLSGDKIKDRVRRMRLCSTLYFMTMLPVVKTVTPPMLQFLINNF